MKKKVRIHCILIFIFFAFLTVMTAETGIAATFDVCSSGCAYSTVSGALKACSSGDTIRIAAGTYNETDIYVGDKQLTLDGGWNQDFTARESNPASTVLDGGVRVDFTSTGGMLNIANLTIRAPSSPSDLKIRVMADGQDPAIINLSSVILRDAEGNGLDISLRGSQQVSVNLVNCMIFSNGTGIYLTGTSRTQASNFALSLINSTVALNRTAGLTIDGAYASISNSILWHNYPVQDGGNSNYFGTTTTPANNADIMMSASAHVTIGYSLYGTVINYGDTSHFTDSGNNLSGEDQDPLFRDAQGADYHLSSLSPCIDAGTAEGAPDMDFEDETRPMGQGIDMGADEYNPCIDDNTPPAPVSDLAYEVSPFNISLQWTMSQDNPYDYVRFFNVTAQDQHDLISEIGPGQQALNIDNSYWGNTIAIQAVAVDKCGNASLPVDIQVSVPAYRQINCPAGAFRFPDLSSKLHLSNASEEANRYFAYGYDENGTMLWEHAGDLAPKASEVLTSTGGLSTSVYAAAPITGFVEMNGTNSSSATYACSSDTSKSLFMAENVCSEDWWSGILVYNPSPETANVTLAADPALLVPAAGTFTVPSMGSTVFIPPCQALSGTFHSSVPVIAMQIVGSRLDTGADIGAMLLPGSTGDAFFLTGIHDGTESWTGFAIYEPSDISGQADIKAVKFSNASSSTVTMGQISGHSRKALNISEQGLDGMEIGIVSGNGDPLQSAGMAIQSSLSGFDLIAPDSTGMTEGFISGFESTAINQVFFFNPGNSQINITCTFYTPDGVIRRQDAIIMPAMTALTTILQGEDAKDVVFMEFSSQQPVFGFMERETQYSLDVLPFLKAN